MRERSESIGRLVFVSIISPLSQTYFRKKVVNVLRTGAFARIYSCLLLVWLNYHMICRFGHHKDLNVLHAFSCSQLSQLVPTCSFCSTSIHFYHVRYLLLAVACLHLLAFAFYMLTTYIVIDPCDYPCCAF